MPELAPNHANSFNQSSVISLTQHTCYQDNFVKESWSHFLVLERWRKDWVGHTWRDCERDEQSGEHEICKLLLPNRRANAAGRRQRAGNPACALLSRMHRLLVKVVARHIWQHRIAPSWHGSFLLRIFKEYRPLLPFPILQSANWQFHQAFSFTVRTFKFWSLVLALTSNRFCIFTRISNAIFLSKLGLLHLTKGPI